jgi:membrane carboxypeptidase/penicillin-binding protein PbpC
VVGVWVGNANNTPMVDVTGVSGAAPIWNEFMRQVLIDQPDLDFKQPDGLKQVEICALSGLLPTPACTLHRDEWFIDGTEPTQPDNLYQVFEIDRQTGLLADVTTPPERRTRETFIVLPQEARDWGIHNGIKPPPINAVEIAASSAPDNAAGLRLLSPAPYTTYQQSPTTPLDSQRVRFSVGVPPGTRSVTYLLNGQAVATVDSAPFDTWWSLQLGDYELTAQSTLNDGSQQISRPVRFNVVEYQEPGSRNIP